MTLQPGETRQWRLVFPLPSAISPCGAGPRVYYHRVGTGACGSAASSASVNSCVCDFRWNAVSIVAVVPNTAQRAHENFEMALCLS